MTLRNLKQAKILVTALNLGLFGLAVNLGMSSLDASLGHARLVAPDARIAPLRAAMQEFPPRKDPPSLKTSLDRGRIFIAGFDARPKPKRVVRIKRPNRRIARPVRGKPGYKWSNIRLAGVVLDKKGKAYAIFEFKAGREQVLLEEGQTLKGGPILRQVKADRAVLEADGERKVLQLVPPKRTRRGSPRRGRGIPVMANSKRPG